MQGLDNTLIHSQRDENGAVPLSAIIDTFRENSIERNGVINLNQHLPDVQRIARAYRIAYNIHIDDILPAVKEAIGSCAHDPATGLRIIYDQGLSENVKKEYKRRSDKPIVLTDDNGFMRLRGITFAKKDEPLFQVVDIIDKMPSRPYLVVK